MPEPTASPQTAALSITEGRMSVAQVLAQRNAIAEIMKGAMRKDIDFGTIPGTPKPTLYKPGSEKILALFHLGIRTRIEDLSTPDMIRYQVHAEIFHQPTGTFLGEGVGEASSAESKYQWRAVVCNEEWDDTPFDRRREKWKKGDRQPYCVRQVRADMDDVANTVLKMAKKRAQIDATLTVTAASDIFAQDLEDLKDAGLDQDAGESGSNPAPSGELKPKTESSPRTTPASASPGAGGQTISEIDGKRFWAKAINRTNDYQGIMKYLRDVHGVQKKDQILMSRYQEAMTWAEFGR